MDQTSQAAAVAVPLAAALGLVGLISMPALAMRSAKNAVSPQRAHREALAAQRRVEGMSSVGGQATIVAPRDARTRVMHQ